MTGMKCGSVRTGEGALQIWSVDRRPPNRDYLGNVSKAKALPREFPVLNLCCVTVTMERVSGQS